MPLAHEFLKSLAIVLGVAALTTVACHRLRLPVVLGYILAGLIVGPHVPVPLVADQTVVQTLSELGVILLMFSLGLEFSFPELVRVAPTAGVTALIQCGVMAWLGFLTGRVFGWTTLESVFTGAVIAISSTTIIAKVFDEQRLEGRLRERVVGILLIEDLVAVLFLAALTTVASGAGLSAAALLPIVGRLVVVLAFLLSVGLLVIPRFIRLVRRLGSPETTVITSIGICFVLAFVTQELGYSVALGAFLAGSLVAESGSGKEIEHLIRPVRDIFAAVFFVSVGLLIDPSLIARYWGAIVALTIVVLVGKIVSVSLGAFLTGSGIRTAIQSGMSLAQIGEFSFIIAGLGVTLGATRAFLYPVAVAVSGLTTLSTPWLIRASEPVAAFIDRKLPRQLQTFAALYGSWVERVRTGGGPRAPGRPGRIVRLLILDASLLSALIIVVAVRFDSAVTALGHVLGIGGALARALIVAAAAVASLPLVFGIGRLAQRFGATLGEIAFPSVAGKADLAAARRRALVVTFQLCIALVTVTVVLAVTQPFLPSASGLFVLGALVVGFGVAIWRSTADLHSHVRAGAQAVLEALTRYARAGNDPPDLRPLAATHELIPGLGEPVALRLDSGSPGVGQTLAGLNLRGRTGATVLAISRGGDSIVVPPATERLRRGDVLALAGTHEAVLAARTLLTGLSASG